MLERNGIKKYLIKKIPHTYKRKIQKKMMHLSFFKQFSLKPSFPSSAIIDPVNVCDLECPLCPTGLKKLNYTPTVMSFNTFKIVIDKIPSLEHICLFNWGEPFLNPSIFKMIGYAKEKNLRVTIHSHFSFRKNDSFFVNISKSRLDTLIVSIDGASQKSYSKYKIGGDFNQVLSNMKRLMKIREELHYKSPNVIWKFIVNRFNEEEIPIAKKISKKLGIEFETAFLGLSDDLPGFNLKDSIEERKEYWLPLNRRYRHPCYRNEYKMPLNNRPCFELFETLVINSDGKVFPCCWITDENEAFGDLKEESFQDIWHNSKYQYSRSLFCKDNYDGLKEQTICLVCENYKKMK